MFIVLDIPAFLLFSEQGTLQNRVWQNKVKVVKKKVKECLIHFSDDDSNFVAPTNEEFRCKSL